MQEEEKNIFFLGDNNFEIPNGNFKLDPETLTPIKTKIINVSGTKFEMTEKTWELVKNGIQFDCRDQLYKTGTEVYLERHSAVFQSILYYRQGGELHMPDGVCPSTFKREIDFWGLDENCLAKCCFAKYVSYMEDQTTLKVGFQHKKISLDVTSAPSLNRTKSYS